MAIAPRRRPPNIAPVAAAPRWVPVLLASLSLFSLACVLLGQTAVLVLFLGSAWEVTIVQDVMTNVFCAAAGLGAFLALERGDRRGDVAACLLLVAAIACWTLGVAFAIGAAVIVLLQPRARSRLWVAAMPLALYAAWALDTNHPKALDLASRARVLAGDVVAKATIDAVQIFGGYGFVNDYPVEKLMRDARAFEALYGDERLGRVLAAKSKGVE